MQQSPNYIHFLNQWQFLGFEGFGQWPSRETFMDLYNKLNANPVDADLDDFSYSGDRCEMGKLLGEGPEGGKKFRKFVCSVNEITLVDEWVIIPVEDFINKLVNVLKMWFKLFPNTAIIAQRCCLRALVQPSFVEDSRKFLGDRIMKIGEPMKNTFRSMPFKVGFTFTSQRQIGGYNLLIDTTVNSWRDNKRVWIQVNGVYPMDKPINATNPKQTKRPFEDCRSFLEKEVLEFLKHFDNSGEKGN